LSKLRIAATFLVVLGVVGLSTNALSAQREAVKIELNLTVQVDTRGNITNVTVGRSWKFEDCDSGARDEEELSKMLWSAPVLLTLRIQEINNKRITAEEMAKLYRIDLVDADLPVEVVPIKLAPVAGPSAQEIAKLATGEERPAPPTLTKDIRLSKSGTKYVLTITRYQSLDDNLRDEGGRIVYEHVFKTKHRYYVGFNAGVFFPTERFRSYSLFYNDPSDASANPRPILKEDMSYHIKGLLFASFYPWGIEPAGCLRFPNNVHLDIGSEISSSILQNFYAGVGYDFNYLSISGFLGFLQEDGLPAEYQGFVGQTIENKNVAALPLEKKLHVLFGVCISCPINLAAIFGKLIGL
jgi:hypothetical protein